MAKKNNNNSVGNYFLKRMAYLLSTSLGAVIVGYISKAFANRKAEDDMKQKEKELDLRNKKALELKKALKNLDTAPDENIVTQPTMSFAQMESRPLANESGWVIPGYAKKGQLSVCVACADIGKSILITDAGIAAALGITPSFLPKDGPKAEKMDVLMYRLEARAGEMNKRYGDGSMFPSHFQWVLGGQLPHFTQGGLIADIASRSKSFTKDTLAIVDPFTKLPDWDASQFITEMGKVRTECANRGVVVSILITAHADETPDWRPLTSKDIRGGDVLIQQTDAVFALRRERTEEGYRFIQTLKVPKGETDRSTVDVIRFVGRDGTISGSYTHLEFDCEKKMSEALPLRVKAQVKDGDGKPAEKSKRTGKLAGKHEEIHAMFAAGKKASEIARHFKVSQTAISDVLKKHSKLQK